MVPLMQKHTSLYRHESGILRVLYNAISSCLMLSFTRLVTLTLPSFIIRQPKDSPKTQTQTSSNISTLDGLRGICCLFVFHNHWTMIIADSYVANTGYTNSHYFFHLPYVHLLWHGSAQVSVFFVLSGYVLSIKCLKQIRGQEWQSFQKTIASCVIRRAIRIFLPPLISLFMCTILAQIGLFDYSGVLYDQRHLQYTMKVEMGSVPPPHLPTFTRQMRHMIGAMLDMIDPNFNIALPGRWNHLNGHFWTIPLEYYCSMILYLVLVGTSRLRPVWRLVAHGSIIIFCWFSLHTVSFLFFSGMTMAELDLIWRRRQEKERSEWKFVIISSSPDDTKYPVPFAHRNFSRIFPAWTTVRVFILLFGMWMLSVPRSAGESTPGYTTAFCLIPDYVPLHIKHDLIRGFGAVFTVWSVSNISTELQPKEFEYQPWWASYRGWISRILANPVSQYLGKISFALYIIHGFVLNSLGYAIMPTLYRITIPSEARRNALAGVESVEALTRTEVIILWTLGYVIIGPVAIWVADVFSRTVDEKCVALGRTVEEYISIESDKVGQTKLDARSTSSHEQVLPEMRIDLENTRIRL